MNNKELGRNFETYINQLLKNHTKCKVYTETEIRSKHKHITAVDHLIETDDLLIAIQDKYVRSRKPSIVDINSFIVCCSHLSKIFKKKCIGVYVSLLELTNIAGIGFRKASTKMNIYMSLSDKSPLELLKKLVSFLYENDIYLYEDDRDDVYMIDDDITSVFRYDNHF